MKGSAKLSRFARLLARLFPDPRPLLFEFARCLNPSLRHLEELKTRIGNPYRAAACRMKKAWGLETPRPYQFLLRLRPARAGEILGAYLRLNGDPNDLVCTAIDNLNSLLDLVDETAHRMLGRVPPGQEATEEPVLVRENLSIQHWRTSRLPWNLWLAGRVRDVRDYLFNHYLAAGSRLSCESLTVLAPPHLTYYGANTTPDFWCVAGPRASLRHDAAQLSEAAVSRGGRVDRLLLLKPSDLAFGRAKSGRAKEAAFVLWIVELIASAQGAGVIDTRWAVLDGAVPSLRPHAVYEGRIRRGGRAVAGARIVPHSTSTDRTLFSLEPLKECPRMHLQPHFQNAGHISELLRVAVPSGV